MSGSTIEANSRRSPAGNAGDQYVRSYLRNFKELYRVSSFSEHLLVFLNPFEITHFIFQLIRELERSVANVVATCKEEMLDSLISLCRG